MNQRQQIKGILHEGLGTEPEVKPLEERTVEVTKADVAMMIGLVTDLLNVALGQSDALAQDDIRQAKEVQRKFGTRPHPSNIDFA